MVYTERQTQIIDQSIEIIASGGIQSFTIKNLSKAIGISEPAIYRHFESKTAILLSILDVFRDMGEMMKLMVDSDGDAIEKIEFMFHKMIEIFMEQPAFVSVIFSEEIFKNEQILKERIIEIQNLHQNNVHNIIQIGQINNDVRKDIEIDTLALIIMGSLRLLVKRWDLNAHDFDLKNEGEKLLSSFRMILKSSV